MLADNDSLKLFMRACVDFAVTRKLLVSWRDTAEQLFQALSAAIALFGRDCSVQRTALIRVT